MLARQPCTATVTDGPPSEPSAATRPGCFRKQPVRGCLAALPADLRDIARDAAWPVELPDGRIVEAHVNLAEDDAVFPSRRFISGDLRGEGEFFLGQDSASGLRSGWFIRYGDPQAWVVAQDEDGGVVLKETPVSSLVCLPPGAAAVSAPVATFAGGASFTPDIPLRSSRPDSEAVLYLDFRGGSIAIAGWNCGNSITYEPPCFDRTLLDKIITRVTEFYAPFDVNVTTDLSKYNLPPDGGTGIVRRRMRCIIARHDISGTDPGGGIGGVARTGDFRGAGLAAFNPGTCPLPQPAIIPYNTVCWGFANPPSSTSDILIVERLGNAIAHELGHTLGLHHWGTSAYPGAPGDYYPVLGLQLHGPAGPDGWAPLMGQNNFAGIVQWAKGEYTGAENRNIAPNKQDDLAVISSSLSAGGSAFLADDKGNSLATAATLHISGIAPDDGGVINSETDEDFFKITTVVAGNISLEVKPLLADGPLDLYAELRDSTSGVLNSNARLTSRGATVSATGLAAGTYYLRVRGNAQENPATDGWSRYGSVGTYRITGTISGAPNPSEITASDPPPPGSVGVAYNFPLHSTFAPTSYYSTSGTLPPGLGISGDAITGFPTTAGVFTVNLAVANSAGGTAKTFTFTIYGSSTLPDALDDYQPSWISTSPPASAPATLWQGQRLITHDGADAARSGSIGANTDSLLTANFTGPGILTFFWRTSCATGDKLILRIDATEQTDALTGITGWIEKTVNIGSGTHPVSWIYRTDPGITAGENAGFVDQVSYIRSPQFIDGNFFAAGVIGKPFARPIPATDNPTAWSLIGGALPPGVLLNPDTGVLLGTPTATGTYDPQIRAGNAGGTSTTSPSIYIYPDISLPAALDNAGLTWSSGGTNPWFGDTSPNHDGTDAAHSGPISHGLSSWLQTTVSGPGTLGFWWKASTELNTDPLIFSLDGITQNSITGEVDWNQRTYAIAAGTHTLRWEYARDGGGSGGQNMGWLDQVTWITPGPTITSPLTVNWTCGQQAFIPLTADDSNVTWTMSGTLPPSVFFLGNPSNVIGAVPSRPGTYSFTLMATNTQNTTTTRTFTMYIESSYTAWARSKGLAAGSELQDPDKDGIPNIEELAFALDPAVRNAPYQPVTYDPVTKRLKASFKRRQQYYPDLMYEVQVSTNLQTWTTIARSDTGSTPQNTGGALSITETEAVPTGQSIYDDVVVDATQQTAGTPRRWMRVKITQL